MLVMHFRKKFIISYYFAFLNTCNMIRFWKTIIKLDDDRLFKRKPSSDGAKKKTENKQRNEKQSFKTTFWYINLIS